MKVLLVNPPLPQALHSFQRSMQMMQIPAMAPPLGLLTVAGLLPREWDLKLVELSFQTISDEEWNEAGLVMVTGTILQDDHIVDIIRQGKSRGKTVVVGGPFAFHFPSVALDAGADLVLRGEAEPAIDVLLERIGSRDFGAIVTAPGKADLSKTPAPRYDLVDHNNYMWMPIQWSRGCPFHCEYCDITNMFGRKFRSKSPQQVLDELQLLHDSGWRGTVFFVDDSFRAIPASARTLLHELSLWMDSRQHPFQFRTQVTVDAGADPEFVQLMVRSGFVGAFVGIESTDRDTLTVTAKFQSTSLDLDKACRTINRAGLSIWAGFMIGFDHEKPGVDRRVIDFVTRNNIPEIIVNPLQALPGTDLWRRLEQEGRLFPDSLQMIGKRDRLLNFVPTRPVTEIAQEIVNIYQVLYEPGRFLERSFQHLSQMEPAQKRNSSQRAGWRELRALSTVLFKHGVIYPSRWKFWRFLAQILVSRRDKLDLFLYYCFMSEDAFHFRRTAMTDFSRGQLEAPKGLLRE